MGIMHGTGEHKPTIFLPSAISTPWRVFGSELFDMILSMEKASAFGAAGAPLLLSCLVQDITVSKGRELAIFAELGVSSSRLGALSSPSEFLKSQDTHQFNKHLGFTMCPIYIQMDIPRTIASRGTRLMLIN